MARYGAARIAEAAHIIQRLGESLSALCSCSDLGPVEREYCTFTTARYPTVDANGHVIQPDLPVLKQG